MAVEVIKTFTTVCYGELHTAIENDVSITPTLEQIVVGTGSTVSFFFTTALTSGEDIALDNLLSAWVCTVVSQLAVSELSNVDVSAVTDDAYIVYDFSTGEWIVQPLPVENVFGSEFQKSEDTTVSTTLSTSFVLKLSMTTPVLPIGTYRIGVSYGWNHNSVSSDFEAQLLEDSTILGQPHRQEPKDSSGSFGSTGSRQKYYTNRTHYSTYASATTHTFDLEFRTDDNDDESSIFDTAIEIWRVS